MSICLTSAVCFHACAIMLFINPTCSERLDKWKGFFWPQMCASSCLPSGVHCWAFVSRAPNPKATLSSEESDVREARSGKPAGREESVSHICFMWFEDIRNGTSFLNTLHTDIHAAQTTPRQHAPHLSLSLEKKPTLP